MILKLLNMRNKVNIIIAVIIAASLTGLTFSVVLIFEYFGITPSFVDAVCTRSNSWINTCMLVSASRFSALRGIPFIGDLPLAVMGFVFYGFTAGIILLHLIRKENDNLPLYATLTVITCTALLADIILFLISFFIIKYLCPFCIMTYATTLIILLLSIFLLKSDFHKAKINILTRIADYLKRNIANLLMISLTLAIAGIGMSSGARLLSIVNESSSHNDQLDAIRRYEKENPVNIDVTNVPYVGNMNSPAHFIVFFDFTCFHCWKEILVLEKLINKYNDQLSISFKSISLNTDCASFNKPRDMEESDACIASAASLCANAQGKYLVYSKLLFENYHEKRIGFTEKSVFDASTTYKLNIANFKQCFYSKSTQEQLALERVESDKLGILTTPTLYLNGRLLPGKSRKADMLEALVLYCIERNK